MAHLLWLFLLTTTYKTSVAEFRKCSSGSVTVEQVTHPVVHGEGPHWDPRRQVLYFVDITNQTVNRYDPAYKSVSSIFFEDGSVSPLIPARKDGWFFIGRGSQLVLFKWDGHSSKPEHVKVVASVDKDKPGNRFNDGKADASGRLWIGTIGPENPDLKLYQASFFSFSARRNFSPEKQLSGVSVSNGLGWNHNDTLMYYIDSPTKNVDVFDFDLLRGTIRNHRHIFNLPEFNITGVPDGMTVDSEGMLWVAVYNGGVVLRINPNNGQLLLKIQMPVSLVTSVAFGGPAHLHSFGLLKVDQCTICNEDVRMIAEHLQCKNLDPEDREANRIEKLYWEARYKMGCPFSH